MALQSTTALATITLQSSATSVIFSGIPQNYRDLVISVSTASTSSTDMLFMMFNNDSSSATSVRMVGNGSTASSATTSLLRLGDLYSTLAGPSNFLITIPDYSATDKHKTYLARGDQSGNYTTAVAGRWAKTEAINSITFVGAFASPLAAGATFSLYGRIA